MDPNANLAEQRELSGRLLSQIGLGPRPHELLASLTAPHTPATERAA